MGELFTIGYEGRSIDQYMDLLVGNQVKALCDVRKNPISRKPGFSKSRLKESCHHRGIAYIHLPDLGIESDRRKNLDSEDDYAKLFWFYKHNTLKQAAGCLELIFEPLSQKGNVAITCLERDPSLCHRRCVAEAMQKGYALAPITNL